MGSRAFRIFLVAFQAVWLNVIVPGHTRGVVTIASTGMSECAMDTGRNCCHPAPRSDSHKQPTSDQKARCALCFFAARLTTPPVIDFDLRRLGFLTVLPIPQPQSVGCAAPTYVCFVRGPPAC